MPLNQEEHECETALGNLLASYPYDSISKFAVNEGFDAINPTFRLVGNAEVEKDNLRFGTGSNCIVLPDILRERLAVQGLTGQLIADENRSHVVLCIEGDGGKYIICDPGLLCVKPFTITPDSKKTEVHIVDNPGGKDRFGFSAELNPEMGRFAITKNKAKSDTQITYNFNLSDLGNTAAIRETDIKDTLSIQIPMVSKLVMPKIGTVASLDAISVRDNRGKVKDFAHRTGIDPEELWRRLDAGNQVRRRIQATHQNGNSIKWIY